MQVVVLGATGNVGSALVEALGSDPAITSIVGVARRRPEWTPARTEWATADVAHDDLAGLFDGADAVVHLAWIFQPTHDQVRTWRTNVLGSIRVFEAVAEAGVPALVHASSIGAYAPGPQNGTVDESWPTHALPTAAYGREKSYLERVLDTFERDHPEVRVVRMRPGFIFQRASAPEQRRLFAGPLVPGRLARPELIPVVPDFPGLRLQAMHVEDAAAAYLRAVVSDVSGPFNVAAEPVVDARTLAELLEARIVRMPYAMARGALAALWHLHLVPASPQLLDLALTLPAMDTTRAREQLGWQPRHSAVEALEEFLAGLRRPIGGPTPPLESDAGGPARWREVATGVGETDHLD